MAATQRAKSEDDETADNRAHLGEVARTARREDDLMDVTMARSRRHEHRLILVLNCGSSSIKFAVFDSSAAPLPRQALWNGKVQGIGGANPDFGETGVAPFPIELETAHPYRAALRLIRDRVSQRLDGRRITMGSSGFTVAGRHVLYDRGTESLWIDQGAGLTAFSGKHKGRTLPLVKRLAPTPWREWEADHPSARLLVGSLDRHRALPSE